MPALTAGAHVAAGVAHGGASLELEGRFDASVARAAEVGEVSAGASGVMLLPCFGRGWARACGAGGVTLIRAEGRGVDNPRRASALVPWLGARVAGEPRVLESLHAYVGLEVTAALRRAELYLSEERVWASSPLAAAMYVGGLWRIP